MNLPDPNERRAERGLLLIFAILSLGIVVGGTFYYRHYERQFRAAAERQLAAIAELKVGELAQYRKERLEDAAIFFNNTAFSGLVRRFFDHPEDADAQRQIQEWTVKLVATGQYDLVRLLDAQGVTRLSSPAGAPPISSIVLQRIPEILRSGQVTFQDFHRNENDQRVYLDILIPLFDEQNASRPLGVFYLRINPDKYLYPFIQRWPVPSETAETLLVRRDGNNALFLNELKFQTNAALNLRISLASNNMPAVKAVLGQEGIVEGTDYRGAPVLAALQAIPDSPWFLVARMDTAEVFAPMRARLWQVVVMICVLIFGSGASVGLVWRRQRSRFYRAQYESAEALRERVKELNCLYAIADLIEKENSLEKILQGSADIMPKGWVHTEIACTRIIFKERQYQTGNFRATDWRQSAALKVDGQPVGMIELWYLEDRPIRDEGPFLKEEKNLINAIAERLGRVAERTQAEDKLRQLSRAVEQSPASIVITNPAGDIEYVNPKFVEVTGYTLAEVLGKNPRILKSGEKSPEAYGMLWQTISAGKEWSGEFHNKKKNGELYWENASISPIRDLAGRVTHYVAVKEDITARKQTEAERDTLIKDLQEALANVKSLSGLLPICASCKKIRDDKGYWSQVESYIQSHSDATFTHGICPDCIKKFYPDLAAGGLGDSSKETT
jgi:PAS domain S-box-containing protein